MIKYIKGNLFSTKDRTLAHCVSSDFALGAGIARQFQEKYHVKDILKKEIDGEQYWRDHQGYCVPVIVDNKVIMNLVTKKYYYQKPNLMTLAGALYDMKDICEDYHIQHISMPKIGCGLDRLNWSDVEKLLNTIFDDTYTITIYEL